MKVLIVDDNRGTSFTLSKFFTLSGHEAEFLVEGKKALQYVKDNKIENFDFVILDIFLNGVSGIDIYNALTEKHQQHKALIITGCEEHTDIFKKALSLGIPVIMKTFKAKELVYNLEIGNIKAWADQTLADRGVHRD